MNAHDNPTWRKFRDQLVERGARTLWEQDISEWPKDNPLRFSLICMHHGANVWIFQVWSDVGFEVYGATGDIPNKLKELLDYVAPLEN